MTCNHKDNYLEAIDGPCGYCEQARAEAAEAKNKELDGGHKIRLIGEGELEYCDR